MQLLKFLFFTLVLGFSSINFCFSQRTMYVIGQGGNLFYQNGNLSKGLSGGHGLEFRLKDRVTLLCKGDFAALGNGVPNTTTGNSEIIFNLTGSVELRRYFSSNINSFYAGIAPTYYGFTYFYKTLKPTDPQFPNYLALNGRLGYQFRLYKSIVLQSDAVFGIFHPSEATSSFPNKRRYAASLNFTFGLPL